MLNKLGHSISNDDIQRIYTTWAAGIPEANDGYLTVPTNIRKNTFIQATSDNRDCV